MVALSFSLNSIGDRITYCRSFLNLTRKELTIYWGGASIPSLARWELNTVAIPQKKLESLVAFFNKKGLLVSIKWINSGEGIPPVNLDLEIFNEVDFDTLAQESLLNINQKQGNFCFGQVKTNVLFPFVKYGDYIGGIKHSDKNISSLKGEFIFVLKGNDMFAGLCIPKNDHLILEGMKGNTEILNIKNIDALGKLQWLIRRL